jgi:hypothetical protein
MTRLGSRRPWLARLMKRPRSLGCVIGMHRSGTSVVTQIAGLLGTDLGPADHFLDTKPDNPNGYFENRDVTRLDDALLRHFLASWDQPPALPPGWENDPALDAFRERASAIMAETFTGSSLAVVKDPRLSLLLPFWRTVVPVKHVLLMVRHPVEVAASLGRRDSMDLEQGSSLWLRYNVDAWLNGGGPTVVAFDDIYEQPVEAVSRVAAAFGIQPTSTTVENVAAVAIDAGLRHHSNREPAGPQSERAVELYELLCKGDGEQVDRWCETWRG